MFCSILIFTKVFKLATYLFCSKENQGWTYCSCLDQILSPSIIQSGRIKVFTREDENGGERIRVIYLAFPPRDIFLPEFSLNELQMVLCFSFCKKRAWSCAPAYDIFTKFIRLLLNTSTCVVSLRDRDSELMRKISAKQD